jgi:hypothetical protein
VRVLIPTHIDDIHATAVALALRLKGHEAVLWHGADLPSRQAASISLGPDEDASWEISGEDIDLLAPRLDVVWYRRPTMPVLPPGDLLHPGDAKIARRELSGFITGLWQYVSPEAFWINPIPSRLRANSKPVQLLEAKRSGFAIPPTLCSNDPRRIREFLGRFPGETVFKPFHPTQWKKEEGIAMLFTSPVGFDDLPDDEVLRLCPGIFQRAIPKACELRVTMMGHHAIVARLLSQSEESARQDWRAAFGKLQIEPGEIPDAVAAQCRELMRRLGIVFGCIDLIVTPEGEHVFLEVNEMGQFLWIDEMGPELATLDAFCEFLIQARSDFQYRPGIVQVSFDEVKGEALQWLEEDKKRHQDRPETSFVDDGPAMAEAGAHAAGGACDHDHSHPHPPPAS